MFNFTLYFKVYKVTADGQEEDRKMFYVNTTAKPVQKDTQDNKDNKDTDDGKDTGKGNGAGSGSDTSYQTPDAGGYSNGEAAYSGGAGGSTDGGAASGKWFCSACDRNRIYNRSGRSPCGQ